VRYLRAEFTSLVELLHSNMRKESALRRRTEAISCAASPICHDEIFRK